MNANVVVYGLCAIKLHFELNILLTWHINYIRCYMLLKITELWNEILEYNYLWTILTKY